MLRRRYAWLTIAIVMLAACASDVDVATKPVQAPPAIATVEPVETPGEAKTTPAASIDAASSIDALPTDQESETDMTSSEDVISTEQSEVVAAPAPTATAEPVETPPPCVRITDFVTDAEVEAWFIVNDNVMGGQSSGGPTFAESAMVFAGEINTDGGGFSSVRMQLDFDALAGSTELQVRARTDGRPYKIILEDNLETRDRRISQQGELEFAATSDWQTVRVPFADLQPKIFGRAIESEAFRPDLATQLGVMISDSVDGPFRIEIDWIDACA